jgi:hypothetical protein
MPVSEERKKRNVAFEKKIKDVSKDDIRVKVIGSIIEKDVTTSSIVIDDGGSKVRVLLNEELFNLYDIGKVVRAIGIVAPALDGEGFELKGELLQDFSGLDNSLYGKYSELKKL